ncbi:MAG TPA: DegT/DnrJ/EryC1/StrS family aminotransferase [Acidimicrobiia bacterium]
MTRLADEYDSMQPEIDSAIQAVLKSGRYTLESELIEFEREFASFVGASHAIGVGSGTDALRIALLLCNLHPGDEVITAPNTDNPTASAIEQAGGTIVFADTNPSTFNLEPASVLKAISPRTRAVLPVHLFGQPANMTEICAIASEHDLLVVEDAALAVGAKHRGQRTGTFGAIGCFSLAPSKILGAFGDAGVLVTDDVALAERARVLRNYGHAPGTDLNPQNLTGGGDWVVLEHGINSRLDALQAAVLRVKLTTLEARISLRQGAAALYNRLLSGLDVTTPHIDADNESTYFAYNVLVDDRDLVRTSLAASGIATRLYYNPPLHLQPAFRHLGYSSGDFPSTERSALHGLALPLFPQIKEEEVQRVAHALESAVAKE